jgi:hypothetical protein
MLLETQGKIMPRDCDGAVKAASLLVHLSHKSGLGVDMLPLHSQIGYRVEPTIVAFRGT